MHADARPNALSYTQWPTYKHGSSIGFQTIGGAARLAFFVSLAVFSGFFSPLK